MHVHVPHLKFFSTNASVLAMEDPNVVRTSGVYFMFPRKQIVFSFPRSAIMPLGSARDHGFSLARLQFAPASQDVCAKWLGHSYGVNLQASTVIESVSLSAFSIPKLILLHCVCSSLWEQVRRW